MYSTISMRRRRSLQQRRRARALDTFQDVFKVVAAFHQCKMIPWCTAKRGGGFTRGRTAAMRAMPARGPSRLSMQHRLLFASDFADFVVGHLACAISAPPGHLATRGPRAGNSWRAAKQHHSRKEKHRTRRRHANLTFRPGRLKCACVQCSAVRCPPPSHAQKGDWRSTSVRCTDQTISRRQNPHHRRSSPFITASLFRRVQMVICPSRLRA